MGNGHSLHLVWCFYWKMILSWHCILNSIWVCDLN
jgi:hypothetical protein